VRARLRVDPERVIGSVDPKVYGQFLSRRPGCAEGGLYDPAARTADAHGIRADVSAAIAACRPGVVRWPGGCTGTSYRWQDGVGPVEDRPTKIDLHFGWPIHYDFGTVEFVDWCRRVGAEPHLNFGLAAASLEDAAAWVEYCNRPGGTYYADLRRRHGREAPLGVRYWQIGNEEYGPWEIGHCTSAEYARTAREWAKAIRKVDPEVRLLAVGGVAGNQQDAGDWAWEVLPKVAPWVDYVTFHTYWSAVPGGPAPGAARPPGEPSPADTWHGLFGGPQAAAEKIEELAAISRTVFRTGNASSTPGLPARFAPRRVKVACTEWNAVPPRDFMSPRLAGLAAFSPAYRLHDALAVATFANVMQRHCRDLTLATVAQSVNVVGLIGVNEEGMWLEPSYWAWHMAANHSGPLALDAWADAPAFDLPEQRLFGLPYLDASVTLDPQRRVLFLSLVNRHRTEPLEVDVRLADAAVRLGGRAHLLHHDDPRAMNTPHQPDAVRSRSAPVALEGGHFTYALPPHAYAVLELPLGA
jgi:alpha-N-arabinofuranosidase